MNLAWNAIAKAENPELGYETGFLDQLKECIDEVVATKVKIVTNAGALNAVALGREVEALCRSRGHESIIVATVVGDDVFELVTRIQPERFRHLDHEHISLQNWDSSLKPSCAAAYIGAGGIIAALHAGADIVICGRVTDASPVIGAAAWWHDWPTEAFDKLAGALVAGHLIECGPYVTGANFTGFKDYLPQLVDLAFPIAEIDHDGSCTITKPSPKHGSVNKANVIAQLLYELQGQLYLNPDVVADISSVQIEGGVEPHERDRVHVSGVKGLPPPPTTKVMLAAPGGYQAETTYYINGLDTKAKAQMMRQQLENIFSGSRFSKFSCELYGTQASDPDSQQEGTVMLRVFVQARRKEDVDAKHFKIPIYSLRMQSYPGYHMNLDFRTMDPKPFMEMFPSTIHMSMIRHQVLIPQQGKTLEIAAPPITALYPTGRPSYETAEPMPLSSFGSTTREPLGSIVHARSGDKANNSNVGFFVRHSDEYPWLQSMLTVEKLKALLGKDYRGQRIERVEFPNILAVHL